MKRERQVYKIHEQVVGINGLCPCISTDCLSQRESVLSKPAGLLIV